MAEARGGQPSGGIVPALIGAVVLGMVVAASAGYAALTGGDRGAARLTGLRCEWHGAHLFASGTVVNAGTSGRFDVAVSYRLVTHGAQPAMDAMVPLDAHSSKTFSWGEGDARYQGERVTACSGTVARDPAGLD
jgi:hypothetical protein